MRLCYYQQFRMQIDKGKSAEYINEFKIIRSLGSGYSAQVFLVADTGNHLYALKKFKPETSTLDTLADQLKVMKEFDHMNLIKLVSVLKDAIYKRSDGKSSKCYAIVLEYADGGELFDYIADTGKFSEKASRTYFHQLLNGLNYMHNKGYAHRDIKPQNLLLSGDFTLKIADFGFSCRLRGHDGSGVLHTRLGTQGYMAPEIENKEYEGKYTDIFAAGVILFIMFSGNPPFENSSPSDPYYKLIRERRFDVFWHAHSRKKTPNFYPETFKDLFQKLVAYIPHDRLMITEIAKHAWIKSGTICSHAEIISEFSERKKKLDQVLEKKRIQQEKERIRRKEVIHTQGLANRGDEEVKDKEFLQIYNKELLAKRVLQSFEHQETGDLVVKGQDHAYTISELKHFLNEHQFSIAEDESEEINSEEEDLDKLICTQIKDNGDKIQVVYTYRFPLDNQIISSTLVLSILMGLSSTNQLIFRTRPLSGNLLLCKRIIADIKRGCWA